MSKDTAKQPVDNIEDDVLSVIDSAENEEAEEVTDEIEEEQSDDVEEQSSEAEDTESSGEVSMDDDMESGDTTDTSDSEESDDGESSAEVSEDKLDPPEHWAAEHKEVFSKQSKEAQEFLIERHKAMEGDYTRGKQEIAAIKRQNDAIQDALSPYQHEFAQAGLDHAGAVRQLASWHNALKTGGKEAVMQLANTYGIDMTQTDDDEYIDPAVRSLRQEIAELKTHTTRQTQAAQQEKQQQLVGMIQAFEAETDEGGNLKHPHFQTLQGDMARLIESKVVDDLGDAYRMAMARHPELTVPKEPVNPVEIKPNRAEKVKKAKKAATGVRSSGAVGKSNRADMTLEQEIAAQIN